MNWAYCKPKLKTLHHVLKILIIKTWKKKEQGEKKQKKAEKNERSLVITYLFSRSSLAITLFVTLLSVSCYTINIFCTFTICSKNAWKCWRWFFSNSACLFPKFVFVFLSHNLRFRYTKNIFCTFTNCSKNFVKMLFSVDFFFKFKVVSKVCFLSHTLLLSVSVTPKTFFVWSPIAHKIQCAHYAVFRFRYTNNIFFLWKHNTIINFF